MFNRSWNIGFLLLAIYLILVGLTALIPAFVIPSIVLGVIALISGIFLLIGRQLKDCLRISNSSIEKWDYPSYFPIQKSILYPLYPLLV